MQIEVEVSDVFPESYEGKKGHVSNNVHLLRDVSPGARLRQFIDWNLPSEQKPLEIGAKHTLTIHEIIGVFGGKVRVRGALSAKK